MDTVSRDVSDLPQAERAALEHIVGHRLLETQRVIVQVIDVYPQRSDTQAENTGSVPSWWKVYEGLSDEEVDRVDAAVGQRADMTRTFA